MFQLRVRRSSGDLVASSTVFLFDADNIAPKIHSK